MLENRLPLLILMLLKQGYIRFNDFARFHCRYVATADLFRKRYQQVDFTNIGLIKRAEFFTDPISHIEIALQNNLDITIAFKNIKPIMNRDFYI